MLEYYVYAYIREDGTPYYIGKGKGKRAFVQHWPYVSTPSDTNRIVMVETNLTDCGACAIERRMIRWFGRKNIDENGILHNKAEGGEGNSTPRTKEWKQHISEISKGVPKKNKENYKGTQSEAHKEACRKGTQEKDWSHRSTPEYIEKNKKAQAFRSHRVEINGIQYSSIKEANRQTGIDRRKIGKMIETGEAIKL